MATAKLKDFEVVRTPKIKDSEGNYVKRGETARLTKDLAEHYHGLGYIRVSMAGLYDEKPEPNRPVEPQPDSEAGSDDESEASEDADADVGASEAEAPVGRPSNRRRKRTPS